MFPLRLTLFPSSAQRKVTSGPLAPNHRPFPLAFRSENSSRSGLEDDFEWQILLRCLFCGILPPRGTSLNLFFLIPIVLFSIIMSGVGSTAGPLFPLIWGKQCPLVSTVASKTVKAQSAGAECDRPWGF